MKPTLRFGLIVAAGGAAVAMILGSVAVPDPTFATGSPLLSDPTWVKFAKAVAKAPQPELVDALTSGQAETNRILNQILVELVKQGAAPSPDCTQ